MENKCNKCNSEDIKHEVKEGRGGSPEWYKQKIKNIPLMPKARISWKGIWDVYTCNTCGETWRILRKN